MEATVTDDKTVEQAAEQDRLAIAQQALEASGQSGTQGLYNDYFGFDETHKVKLPDGVSWIEHKALNEGGRRRYLDQQNRDVTLEKVTGNVRLRMLTGSERRALLQQAIVGWNLKKRDTRTGELSDVPFQDTKLNEFLDKADPKVIDLIEKDVRRVNPWLGADVTIEDIDKQIDELKELRAQKVKEAEGNAS